MPDQHMNATLWSLFLGVVIFIGTFVLIINFLLPVQVQVPSLNNPRLSFPSTSITSDVSGSALTAWSSNGSFSMSFNSVVQETYGPVVLRFVYYKGDDAHTYFGINHVKQESWWIISLPFQYWGDWLQPPGVKLSFITHGNIGMYGQSINAYGVPDTFILSSLNFNNDTGISTFGMQSNSISLSITLSSNSTALTLPQTLSQGQDLLISFSYTISFTEMEGSGWTLLVRVLSFSVVSSGQAETDFVFNCFISLPVYASFAYLFYRFLTGIIPTLSGGGGQ